MPRTLLPLPPLPATSPSFSLRSCFVLRCGEAAWPNRRGCFRHLLIEPSGAEILVPCSVASCTALVSVLLGTDTAEEAAVDALCVACSLELMAKQRTGAA